MNKSTFYMVFVERAEAPIAKHPTCVMAEAEAKRLTLLTGKPSYVLKAILETSIIPQPTVQTLNLQ